MQETIELQDKLADTAKSVDRRIEELLKFSGTGRLVEAMLYSCLSGGKRLRPYLTLATSHIFSVDRNQALTMAAIIEMVHTYSLIHDDLPAMDNDNLRRGKPTCHKKFDEATAILAGDALLTYSFEILSSITPDLKINVQTIICLSQAIGTNGMAGGQMLDLTYENMSVEESEVLIMHSMKTGKLFSAASQISAIAGKASIETQQRFAKFGLLLGISFQIVDDIIDIIGEEKTAGKKLRKDSSAGKASYAHLFGIERAKTKADELMNAALEELKHEHRTPDILELTNYIIDRKF